MVYRYKKESYHQGDQHRGEQLKFHSCCSKQSRHSPSPTTVSADSQCSRHLERRGRSVPQRNYPDRWILLLLPCVESSEACNMAIQSPRQRLPFSVSQNTLVRPLLTCASCAVTPGKLRRPRANSSSMGCPFALRRSEPSCGYTPGRQHVTVAELAR